MTDDVRAPDTAPCMGCGRELPAGRGYFDAAECIDRFLARDAHRRRRRRTPDELDDDQALDDEDPTDQELAAIDDDLEHDDPDPDREEAPAMTPTPADTTPTPESDTPTGNPTPDTLPPEPTARLCPHCGDPLPASAPGHQRYCDTRCAKAAAYRRKLAAPATATPPPASAPPSPAPADVVAPTAAQASLGVVGIVAGVLEAAPNSTVELEVDGARVIVRGSAAP